MEQLLPVGSLVGLILVIYVFAFPVRKYFVRKMGWAGSAELGLAPGIFILAIIVAVVMTGIKAFHNMGIIQ